MGSRSQELPIFVHYCINGKTVLYLPIYDFNVGKYVDIDTVKSVKFFKIRLSNHLRKRMEYR